MVSELAGEGAMPLPKPASHAELQVRRQIRSSLRRGVNSLFNLGVVLFFQSRVSRSRFVKSLSKVLISSMFSILNRSRSGLISNRVFVNLQFIAFSWSFRSRSVEITSTALVNQPIACVGENNQSSFWILCVLTAAACCVSTGFADKSKRREAPNVTPTERSPAIPIIVQSSPVKDRIANTKPSDQQRSPGRLKLSSTKLSSICFIRSLECGKYPGMFASRGIVRLSQKSVTNNEINQFNAETKEMVEVLRVDLLIDNLNSSYGSAGVVCDSESVSSGSGLFLTRSLVMVFVYECYAYPAYECFKAMELNKPDIQQLRLIEMQSFSVVLHFVDRFEFDRDDRKIVFNMINDLTGVEKAKNVVIQFQISLSKTNIEQSIVVFDYTQMDRSLKEERTALIKSCFDAKGSATGGEMEDFVELEEQLLKMRFQSLNRFITEKESSISLFDTNDKSFSATATSHPSVANEKCVGSRKFLVTAWREYVLRQESIHCSIVHDEYMGNQLFRLIRYKRFCKAALAAQIAAGPLFAPVDMSAFESKYKDPSSIKWTVNITSEKFVELMLMRIPTKESIVNTRLILKNYPAASVAGQDILDIRFKLWKDMGDIRFLILAIGNAVAFKKTFSLLLMLFG